MRGSAALLWSRFNVQCHRSRSGRPVVGGGLRAAARAGHVARESGAASARAQHGLQRGRPHPGPAVLRAVDAPTACHYCLCRRTDPPVAPTSPKSLLQTVPIAGPVGEVEAEDQDVGRCVLFALTILPLLSQPWWIKSCAEMTDYCFCH